MYVNEFIKRQKSKIESEG